MLALRQRWLKCVSLWGGNIFLTTNSLRGLSEPQRVTHASEVMNFRCRDGSAGSKVGLSLL